MAQFIAYAGPADHIPTPGEFVSITNDRTLFRQLHVTGDDDQRELEAMQVRMLKLKPGDVDSIRTTSLNVVDGTPGIIRVVRTQ